MLSKWLQRLSALLMCGAMLIVPAAAEDGQAKKDSEEQRKAAYLVELEQQRLLKRYQNDQLTLQQYFEEKRPLDAQQEQLGSPFDEAVDPTQMPARYRTLYRDIQLQKQLNEESRAGLEETRHGRGLADPAYYQQLYAILRKSQELEKQEQCVLWQSRENPQGQGSDTGDMLWKALYRVYRNEQERQLLQAVYEDREITKERFIERRDELQAEGQQAQAAVKKAEREAEEYQLRAVVSEDSYSGYWQLKERLSGIEKELQKLREQWQEEKLETAQYWEQKRALEAEQQELREKKRTLYQGYED